MPRRLARPNAENLENQCLCFYSFRRFPGPMPGEDSAVPTEDCVGLNHLETSPPTGPEPVQHNPKEPIAAVQAQATRCVLLENRGLMTKREDFRLQGSRSHE
jgi:hypothetical protein